MCWCAERQLRSEVLNYPLFVEILSREFQCFEEVVKSSIAKPKFHKLQVWQGDRRIIYTELFIMKVPKRSDRATGKRKIITPFLQKICKRSNFI